MLYFLSHGVCLGLVMLKSWKKTLSKHSHEKLPPPLQPRHAEGVNISLGVHLCMSSGHQSLTEQYLCWRGGSAGHSKWQRFGEAENM